MEACGDQEVELAKLSKAIRNYRGLTRKAVLAELLEIMGESNYDDAGALKFNGKYVVVSTDGIVESLVKEDAWLAGFYSVVVNVNDVVAKGACPVGYVCVVSSGSTKTSVEIIQGVRYGLDKYNLKFLKAHTHPDTSFDAIDAAVIGFADNFLSSTGAKPKDSLIAAIDLDGKHGSKGWVRTFDSVRGKPLVEIQRRLKGVVEVAKKNLASASRDISGPGIVGTIGMLCESSRVGAEIHLDAVPKPQKLELSEWLITYPSMGFIFATNKPEECMNVLKNHGFATSIIGEILDTRSIELFSKSNHETLIDLTKESIFGFRNPRG